jgi:hypothetical protein
MRSSLIILNAASSAAFFAFSLASFSSISRVSLSSANKDADLPEGTLDFDGGIFWDPLIGCIDIKPDIKRTKGS